MINEEENKQKAPAMDWDGNVVEETNKSNPQAMDWEGNVIEATATEIPAEQVKKKDIFSESASIPQAVRPMESTSRPVSGWGGVLSATGKANEAPQQKTIAFDEREAQREAQRRATGKQGESPLKVVAQKQEISKDVQALAAAKRTEDQIREEQRAANLKGAKDTYGYSEAWQLTNQLDVQRGVLEKFADADAKQIKLLLDEAEKLNINDSSYQLLSDNIQKNISTGNLAGAEELRNDWNDRLKKLKQIEYKVRPLQAKLKYATDRITKFNDEREYIAENYWGAGLDKLSAGLGSTYAMLLRTPGFVEEYLRNVAGGIMGESQGGVDAVTAFRDTQTPFGSLEKGADYFEKQSENQLYVAQNAYKRYEQSISEAFSNGDYASGLDMLWRGSLESVPTTAAIATLSYMGVPPGLITAGGGVVFAAGKFDELKKENPYMDRGLMYTNAFFTGYAESLSEILGTGLIVRQAQKLYKIGGKKAVDKFAKDSWEAIYERNMKRYFPLVGAAEEGGTEAINAYTSNMIDIASGVDPNRDPMKGVWDAFYVGSAMGAPTAIIASYAVRKSEEKNKKYEEYLKKLSELNNAASKPNLPDDVRDDINNQAQAVADELNNFLVYEKSMFNNMPEQTQKRAAYLINQIDKYEESRDNLKDPVVTENLNNRIAAMQNELGNILSDYNKQKGEVQDLAKYTSGTKEKYGYIDRGDGKGKIDLTQEEYEAEQAKMQPKVDVQVTPTAEGERVEEVKLAELPTKTIQAEVVEEKPTIITNEKEPTKTKDGEPMPEGVQGVRPEGQAGKESAELRTEEKEVADQAGSVVGGEVKPIFIQKFFADKPNENLTDRQINSVEKAIAMGIEAGKSGDEIYGILNALGFTPANVGGSAMEINLREYLNNRVAGKDNRTFQETQSPQAGSVVGEEVEAKRIETEAKIKRKDLFSDGGVFANELGGSGVNSVPTNHSERNGIEFVQFSNPNTGIVDVIMTGKSDNDFVGYYRIYENGKATNKWSSKFENQSRNKEDFKTMISGVQEMLPQGHEYTEKTSISTDGLRIWNQQLNRGYELQYDDKGNLITNRVAINGDAINNELGIAVNKGNFENVSVTNNADMKKVKEALLPYLQKFGLNESNIHFENGTVEIDLPVLKSNKAVEQLLGKPKEAAQTAAIKPEIVTEKEVAETAQKAGITPKNLRDLYKINRELFGLDRIKSLASAIAMDRMVGAMAKRANITKAEMYGRLKFEKASEEFVRGLSDRAKVLWQIVGENAQLAQDVRDNLQVARDMEAAGKDAKTIRLATGWERGADKKWRYETSDNIIPLSDIGKKIIRKIIASKETKQTITLSDLGLEVKGYPQLNDLKVELRPNTPYSTISAVAEYNPNTKTIVLADWVYGKMLDDVEFKLNQSGEFGSGYVRNDNNLYRQWVDFNSTILHEIQHAIQDIEGFAKGGSPKQMSTPNDVLQTLASPFNFPKLNKDERAEAKQKTREMGLRFSENFYFDVISDEPNVIEDAIDRLEILNKISPNDSYVKLIEALDYKLMETRGVNVAFEKYKRLAGEVEARNVQTRMGMTPEQRRATTLQETEKVARDEQIVLFDSKGIQMQVDAWHGSPYQFDRFTTEKIGTGEGAQAFGWGLYFTDLESIARDYAEKLSGIKAPRQIFRIALEQAIDAAGGKNNFNKEKALEFVKNQPNWANIVKDWVTKTIEENNINEISRVVYKVSIHKGKTPDQYTWLEWDKPVSEKTVEKITKALSIWEYDSSKDPNYIGGQLPSTKSRIEISDDGNYYRKITDTGLGPINTSGWTAFTLKANGKFFYNQLSKIIGNDKKASLFLLENGIDGVKYPAESIARGTTSDTARGFNYVVFDENAVSIEEVIKFQKDAEKARGAMMISMDGQAVIYALTDPNVSTPLHEMAHVFEHYLTDAERAIVQSWAGTKGWTTQTSEKFARGFEKYLAEGKAPTSGLQKIFDKFKTWLTDIYNGITGSDIDIELNEPMREIYAKMLGLEQSLQSAPQAGSVVVGEVLPKYKNKSIAERFDKGLDATSVFEGGEINPEDVTQRAAWRSMGKKELEGLLGGNEIGGSDAKKGNYFGDNPAIASSQKGEGKYLVEFGGKRVDGETTIDKVSAKDITGIWKYENGKWNKLSKEQAQSLQSTFQAGSVAGGGEVKGEPKEATDFGKAISASSRFRPYETVIFDKPIIGKNGNKLISYQWAYEWTMLPNWEGELKSKRVSDWTQAESSAETGRDIVHKFTVERTDGVIVTVSSETIPSLLGYVDAKEMKNFPSIVSSVKTLAKQRMQLAILKAQEAEYNAIKKEVNDLPKPKIVPAEIIDLPKITQSIVSRDSSFLDRVKYWKTEGEIKVVYRQENKSNTPDNRTKEQLLGLWEDAEIERRGGKKPQGLYDLERRIERQEKKVEQATGSKLKAVEQLLGKPKEATPQAAPQATPQAAEEQLGEPKAEVVSEAQAQPAGEIAFTAPTAEVKEQPKGLLKPKPGSLSVKVGEANQMGRAGTVAYGDNVEIVMADGTIRQGRYAAVEAEDVLFSHNEEVFNDTDGFPEYDGKNANSRNYKGDKSASGNVDNYARNLIPSVVLADSATPSEGSPIVSTDKIGVSGNNRGMSIKRAIKMYPEKYAEYRKKLEERAKRLGIDPEQLRGMKNPMLVRIDSDVKEYTPAEFDKYNKDAQKAESPIDFRIKQSRIIQGSKSLREGIYKILGDFETVGELWNNRSAVRQLFELLQQNKLITAAELPAYINADGTITEAGKDYVGDVAVGTILSDDTIKATENIKSFRNKVLTVLPLLAKNYSFGTDYSLSNEINEALRIQSDFANSGFPADKFLNWAREINMYGRNYTENGMAMNRIIDASSTSGKGGNKLKEILTRYNNSAAGSQGALLFEEERVSKEEAFDSMRSILDKETNDTVIAYGKMEENEEAASERERRASEARRSEQELGDTDESILKQIDNGDGTYSPTNEKQAEVFFRVVTKMRPQMAAANAQLVEARANGWASLTGKPKSEFYTGVAFEYADPNAKVGNRGKWRKSAEKNKKIITLTPKYNSSTLVHELLGHDYFDDIIQAGREDLLMALINEWKNYSGNKLSVERALEILKNFDPTKKTGTPEEAVAVAIHEFFANGAEQYMKDPQSIPNEKLRDLFELFRQWLAATMNMFSQKGIEITSFMRDVYAAGLGGAGLSHVDTSNMVNKRSNDDTSEYIKESISGKTSENISSGLNELFQLGDFVEIIDGWYSPIEKNVKEYGKDKIKAKDWLNVVGKGDESVFTGVRAFLEGKDPNAMVSKQEILDYMKDNRISVVEVVKGGFDDGEIAAWWNDEGGANEEVDFYDLSESEKREARKRYQDEIGDWGGTDTKFSQYQLEGEKENYKEVLVILPRTGSMAKVGDYKVPSAHQYGQDLSDNRRLVHLRMNTRTDADGNKVLFLEEVQSDWGQKGKKKGFKTEPKYPNIKEYEVKPSNKGEVSEYGYDIYGDGNLIQEGLKNEDIAKYWIEKYKKTDLNLTDYKVPTAPFVMDTNAWTKLGLKVALKEAVKQGADKIAWTTGEQQNERYDLSKQVDEIRYSKNSDGTYSIIANKNGNDVIHKSSLKEKDLEASFGKDVAQRIINNEGDKSGLYKSLKGENLSVGGKGMKGFYGSIEEGTKGIVGGVAEKVFGQKVGTVNLTLPPIKGFFEPKEPMIGSTQPSIDITPELKAQVQEGLPLFQESERDQKIRNGLRELAVSGYRDKLTDKHNVSRWAKTLLKPELHPYIDEMLDELQALDVPENGQRFHETAEELLADPSIPEQVKTEIRQNRVRSYDPKSLYEALKNAEATIDTIGLNNALNAIRNNKTDFDFPFVSAVFRRINAEIRDLNRRGLKEEAKKLMEQSAILAEELINEASTRGSKLNEVKALYLLSPDGRVQFLKRRWNKMNEGRNAKVKDVVKQLKNELNKALSGIDYLINENFKEETKREELNEQIVALRTEIEAMEAARDRMPKEGGYDSKKGAKIKVPKENRPSLVAQIKAQRAAMKSQGLMQTDVSELDPSLQLAYSLLDDNSIGLKTFKKRFEKEIDEQISWEEAAELYNNAVVALKDNGSSIKYETAEQVNLDAEANSAEAAAKLAEKQMRAAIKQAQMQAAQQAKQAQKQAAQAQKQAAQQAAQAQKQAAQQAAYSPATDVAETVVKAVKNIMGLVTPKQKTILEQIVKKLKDKSFDYLPEVAKKSATPDELLAFAIDNMVSLQGQAIWNDAVAEVMDMIANDPNMTASEKAAADTLLKDFYNVVFDTVLPKSNQWKIIQEAIINHGEYVTISPSGNASINWSKLIQSGQQKKTNWKISVFDEIINMLPAGSQNDPATQKVLNVLLNRIDTILEDKKNVIAQRQLDNAKKTIAGRTVSTKKSARKNNALQIVRLFNTGALDDASALPIFEEYFGMANPDWNRIKQLSELIEKAPTGNLASRAIEELAFEMESAMPGMGQKILDSYFYNNMLSSPITFIKNLSSLAKNFILAVGSTATTLDANYLKAFRKGYTMGDFGDILLYGGLNQGSNLDVMVMADGMPVTRPLEYINANNILMQVVKSTRVVSRLLEATDAANQRAATEMQQYKSLKQYLKQQNVQDVRETALKILRGENVSDVEKQSLEAEVRQTQREFGLPETGSSFMREYYRRLREIALSEVGYDESQAAMEEERGVEAGLRSTYRTPLKYDGFFTGLGKMLSDVFQSANKGIESSDNPIAKKIAKGFLGATKKITFPFLKVPANLFESGLELIPPYGMLKYGTIAALNYTKTPITDAEKLKSAITKDRIEQYFRGSAGAYLLLGGLAYLLIKASKSWDEDPENKDKPKTGYNPPMTIGSRDAGESMISPNSITMFGKTIGMGWFGEYGVPISAVMIYFDLERERETRKALSKDLQERSLIDDESFFKEYMNRLGGYFLSTSVLTGSDNIMRIWQAENDMGGKMAKTGMTYAYNQFIPFSSFIRQGIEVGKSASGIRAQKPVTTSEYVWSALAMQGVATEERPALDIFGDPIRPIQKSAEGVGVITQFIDPVRFEEYKMWWADVNPGYLKSTYSDYSKNMVDVESKNGVDFYKYEEMVRKMYGENVYSMYDNKEYRNLTDTELESMKNIPENEAMRIAYREDLREMWNITRRYGIIRQKQDMGYLDVTQAKELKELRNAMFKLRKLYLPKYESYRENRNAEKNLREAVDYELSGDLIEE